MSTWSASYDANNNIYAIPFLISNGNAIKTDGTNEAFNSSHLTSYAVAYTGSGPFYSVAVPSTLPTGVDIGVIVLLRLGGSPAGSDSVLGGFSGSYDGSAWTDAGGGAGGDSAWTPTEVATVLAALSGDTIEVSSPHLDGDDIELVVGDDYLGGRLSWSTDTDFTGQTITLALVSQIGGDAIDFIGAVSSPILIIVSLTHTDTSALTPGDNAYKYKLTATNGTTVTTLKIGYVTVVDGV